jgi:hypothetical protein
MTKTLNYYDILKRQESIILKHYSSPIYTNQTRTTALPVHRKKMLIKKTLKQASKTDEDSTSIRDKEKQTKKRGNGEDASFIVED